MNLKAITARNAWYVLAVLLGLAVAAVGYISSFDNLATYAKDHGFPFGAALPVGLDLAIPALLILDWLRPSVFLRSAAWALAGGTVFANGTVADGRWEDRALHALMPALAIVIIEAARHLRGDPARMDRIRLSRWLLSPVRTARLWRRMSLWEITSYSEALLRESAILHARTVLVAAYDRKSWAGTRRRVPLTLRHQLATGQIPSSVLYGPDLQTQVRDWVRATLADLAAQPVTVPAAEARSRQDQSQDSEEPEPNRWDLIWDLQDSLRPAEVPAETFAAAIGLARHHFEQVGTHITNEDLQDRLKIAKARANAIGRRLRTSYETGPDLADRTQDSPTLDGGGMNGHGGTSPDLALIAGPDRGLLGQQGGDL